MNKLSQFALTIFGVATIVSCNQQGSSKDAAKTNDSTANKTESTASGIQTIVYVNSDTLSDQYEYFKEVRSQLENKVKKAQSDLQAKGQAFQRELAEAEQKAANMSASERQATEERLARKQQELSQLNQNASSALAQDEATEFGKVYTAITDYLKKHAEENKYTLVLTYSKTNPAVLYADPKLDITSQVLKGLNDEYKTKKPGDKK